MGFLGIFKRKTQEVPAQYFGAMPAGASQPPRALVEWSLAIGQRVQAALWQQGVPTHIETRRPGLRRLEIVLIPKPPTPATYSKLLACDRAVRLLLGTDDVTMSEQAGRVVVSFPHPFAETLDPWSFEFVDGDPFVVPVGLTEQGRIDKIDWAVWPHVGIYGPTGGGKTSLTRMIVRGLVAQNGPDALRVVAIGAKPGDWEDLEFLPHSWGFVHHRNAAPVIEWLFREYERRNERPGVYPKIFVVLDDLVAMLDKKFGFPDLAGPLGTLVSQTRSAGIHLVVISQLSTSEGVGSSVVSRQIRRRFVTGAVSKNDASLQTGIPESGAELLRPGESISVEAGRGEKVYVPFVPAWGLSARLEKGFGDPPPWSKPAQRPVVPSVAPTTARNGATTAYNGPQRPTTPVVAPASAPGLALPEPETPPAPTTVATVVQPLEPLRQLPRRAPEPGDYPYIREVWQALGRSNSQTCRTLWGYKDGKTLAWLKTALGSEEG